MLAVRLIEISYFSRSYFHQEAEKNKETFTLLHGGRGRILDRNEQTIARSITKGQLWMNARDFKEKDFAISTLAWDECRTDPEWNLLTPKEQKQKKKETHNKLVSFYKEKRVELEKRYLAYVIDHLAPVVAMQHDEFYAAIIEKIATQNYFLIPCKGRTDFVTHRKNDEPTTKASAQWLDDDTCTSIQEALDNNHIFGLELVKVARREYVSSTFATHLVGYTKSEKYTIGNTEFTKQIGKYGVEGALDKELAGQDGYRRCITNPSGELIGKNDCKTELPRHGHNVVLTVDTEIQNILQEELAGAIREYNAPHGCIIVMEPKTGEILGMANYPYFDLVTFEGAEKNSKNFSTQMIYEPGSTIKALSFAAALNEGCITRQTPINCHNGRFERGSFSMKDLHPNGVLTAEWVIGKSSNIGVFMITERYGMRKHYDYLAAFGLGSRTGIELTGESAGVFRRSDNETEFASKTYGYNISVTPLQMASAYSVIANGGKYYKPTILKSIIASDGTVVKKHQPKLIRQVISEKAAREARIGLTTVLTEKGTAKLGVVPGHEACGKTGTVRKWNEKAKAYFENRYLCSFAGMLPAQDPEFVCVVVIDDPKSNNVSLYGGTIAGPVFSRVCSRVAEHLHIAPTVAIPPHVANQ
jgi:cell division protein FtsI/penicillin-binding protein 2